MKKQQKKPISRDAVSQIKRHFDVVAEKLGDKISVVAEQHGDIKRTLDSHTEMIGSLQEDVTTLKEDVTTLTTDMQTVKEELHLIRNELKEKVSREEFVFLEQRVIKLERLARQ